MRNLLVIYFCLPLFSFAQERNYTQFVDPFIGTGGHGHAYPGATLPFGMVQLSPDTRIDGSWDGCSGYHYSDSLIYGFSHTHLSGTGVSDYGDILLMPVTGEFIKNKKYSSHFSHSEEMASPGYYSVYLKDYGIIAELTATERTGFHQYTFPSGINAGLIVDLRHRDKVLDSELIQIDKNHIGGYRRSSGWAKDQVVYFYMEFDNSVQIENIISDSASASSPKTYRGNICAYLKLDTTTHVAKIKVALSAVSIEGAKKNMQAENRDFNFEEVKEKATEKWNKELSKIEVSGGSQVQYKIFYTALYHCMIVPNIYNDVDGKYRSRDSKVYDAKSDNYTVFSLWDTFRAWHPLMTIIDQKRTLNYIKSFLRQYEKGGLLPVWELSANETECMIGYHSVSVIADAYAKGIRDFNTTEALNAMIKSAEAKDRYGLGAYIDHGYLDALDESESVSKTLEYSYDDWCIAYFASAVGKVEKSIEFNQRANHWMNLFDTKTKFVRPKKNGTWIKPFDPHEVNNNYTEANGWQYTFFVPQNIPGLICKMGGQDQFEKKLDELFSTQNKTTGRDQPDITGMIGQYAHGNEPSHHMAYLYNYTNNKWKTQEKVSRILNEMYSTRPDGLIGNEDCGQMSAWYIMSAIGIYQVCPGMPTYQLTTPLFSEIIIHLENGKDFKISREDFSESNRYIKSISLNGSKISNELNHVKLISGGQLVFKMGNKKNDIAKDSALIDAGYNLGRRDLFMSDPCSNTFIPSPVIYFDKDIFREYADISIEADSGLSIYYTVNGNNPDTNSVLYTSQFRIDSTSVIKAIAVNNKKKASYVATSHLHKMEHPDWKIKILSKYNTQYTAGGDDGIIDGIRGDVEWRKGGWQGYQDQNFEAIIDFGKATTLSAVYSGFLQDTRSWIIMPSKVEYEISSDGINFRKILSVSNSLPDTILSNTIINLGGKFETQNGQYLKVKAYNYGKLPSWHQGAGNPAFIFIDEVKIE